jgi:hypothetical protein
MDNEIHLKYLTCYASSNPQKLPAVQFRLCETEHCDRKQGTSLRIVISTTTIRQLLMLADLDVRYCERLGCLNHRNSRGIP